MVSAPDAVSRGEAASVHDRVWSVLSSVPDPEMPMVSIVELGIVRDVGCDDEDGVVVTLTPTYSGCPAARTIALDVELALVRAGIRVSRIRTALAPAWTTDWIAPAARDRLHEAGIVPPDRGAATVAVHCPRCGSADTKIVSEFGATPCKASHLCRACLEPFERMKCI